MIYTYAILISMILTSLFLAVIWSRSNFLNFTIKIGWFTGSLLGIQTMFKVSGEVEHSFIEPITYFWFSAVLWSLAALTWRRNSWKNIIMKFITITIAMSCWVWIILN